MSVSEKTIDYTPDLKINNLDALGRGTGAKWLLVVESPYPNEYVAKRWCRKAPKSFKPGERLIRF